MNSRNTLWYWNNEELRSVAHIDAGKKTVNVANKMDPVKADELGDLPESTTIPIDATPPPAGAGKSKPWQGTCYDDGTGRNVYYVDDKGGVSIQT